MIDARSTSIVCRIRVAAESAGVSISSSSDGVSPMRPPTPTTCSSSGARIAALSTRCALRASQTATFEPECSRRYASFSSLAVAFSGVNAAPARSAP